MTSPAKTRAASLSVTTVRRTSGTGILSRARGSYVTFAGLIRRHNAEEAEATFGVCEVPRPVNSVIGAIDFHELACSSRKRWPTKSSEKIDDKTAAAIY
jgi:hypothetical protein